jgi:hypothetical protein
VVCHLELALLLLVFTALDKPKLGILSVGFRLLLWQGTANSLGEETAYSTGNINMAGNQILYHLNETVGATTFADNSDLVAMVLVLVNTCPTSAVLGSLIHQFTLTAVMTISPIVMILASGLVAQLLSLSGFVPRKLVVQTFWDAPVCYRSRTIWRGQ